MNPEVLFFDEAQHNEALSLLASRCLVAGDAASAFTFADRRCRSSLPSARDFLLRSEASRLAGYVEFAQRDLRKALEIDPCDALVNERLMRWGAPVEQESAAVRLIDGGASDKTTLACAVAILLARGAPSLCHLNKQQDSVVGWIAWSGLRPLTLRIAREATAELTLERIPSHYLAGPKTSAAEIEIVDETSLVVGVDFFLDGRKIGGWTPVREPVLLNSRSPVGKTIDSPAPIVSIIVPVYEDLEATQECLRSLFELTDKIATRIILVDDCSPNVALSAYLDDQATRRDVLLLRNECNVGFAGSVNRALRHCEVGDALLLNADAQLPNGAIDRLFAASNAVEDIGTLTPLSNNGEFTSFPEPNVANPLPSQEAIAAIDRRAAIANHCRVVDLPNGIGFCLYIKRACLDAVGPLPEIYRRGYYEDVEFCLRARERGFRNVCATNVFVGHAGAKSFSEGKRALVVRNLRVLEDRFPNYKRECAAFLAADPLKAARRAIELLTPIQARVALLVSNTGLARALAETRAQQLGTDVYPIYCTYSADGRTVEFKGQGQEVPQSTAFALDRESDVSALRSYLSGLELQQIELFDLRSIPEKLFSQLTLLGVRLDVICGDPQWCDRLSLRHVEGPCRATEAGRACDVCLKSSPWTVLNRRRRSKQQHRVTAALNSAYSIKPLDRMAEAFVRRSFKKRRIVSEFVTFNPRWIRARSPSDDALAILAPVASGLIDRQIITISRRLVQDGLDTKIVVLGRCVDDLTTMGAGNVFVAGKIDATEYLRLIAQYRIFALMSPYRTCFFGLVDQIANETGLPKAYFDWSFAALETNEGDLSLDPRVCDEGAASAIANWLAPVALDTSGQ